MQNGVTEYWRCKKNAYIVQFMQNLVDLDSFDCKLLAAIQGNAGLTNQDIGDRINLSASQVSRRRQRLEGAGVIRRYRAELSLEHLGIGVTAFIGISLATHNRENSKRFFQLVQHMPCVQEAYAMTGDFDYLLKVCVSNLKELSLVINDDLLPHEAVQNVRSSIAMETLKNTNELPIPKSKP